MLQRSCYDSYRACSPDQDALPGSQPGVDIAAAVAVSGSAGESVAVAAVSAAA